ACWRLGTTGEQGSFWPQMRDGSYMAVQCPLGSLSWVDDDQDAKAKLAEQLRDALPSRPPHVVSRDVNELVMFLATAQVGDTVLAMQGLKVLGIGRVEGEYFFVSGEDFGHRRAVNWLSTEEWQQPEREAVRTTFRPIKKPENLLQVEARLLGVEAPTNAPLTPKPSEASAPLAPLTGTDQRIDAALNRKGQVILYGPPGTGKTYSAMRAAREILARSWFGKSDATLSDGERGEVETAEALSLVSFHPGYGYEDFVEGYRPVKAGEGVAFDLKAGLLKRLAERAATQPKRKFILIIDEINRGDVPRICSGSPPVMVICSRQLMGIAA
ncbi:MAG: AAA family ATPase, partial [Myxococcales bacterium]|nr:AAA family ATPase [Myxococcales bacterium]